MSLIHPTRLKTPDSGRRRSKPSGGALEARLVDTIDALSIPANGSRKSVPAQGQIEISFKLECALSTLISLTVRFPIAIRPQYRLFGSLEIHFHTLKALGFASVQDEHLEHKGHLYCYVCPRSCIT